MDVVRRFFPMIVSLYLRCMTWVTLVIGSTQVVWAGRAHSIMDHGIRTVHFGDRCDDLGIGRFLLIHHTSSIALSQFCDISTLHWQNISTQSAGTFPWLRSSQRYIPQKAGPCFFLQWLVSESVGDLCWLPGSLLKCPSVTIRTIGLSQINSRLYPHGTVYATHGGGRNQFIYRDSHLQDLFLLAI